MRSATGDRDAALWRQPETLAQPTLVHVASFAGNFRPVFFWLAIVGGLLIAVGWLVDPAGIISGIGVVFFLSGLVWFFYLAFRDARHQGTTFGRAVRSSATEALKFAWLLMP